MGPRSDGRGYATHRTNRRPSAFLLQWVHGRMAVVMRNSPSNSSACCWGFNGSTVGWPWLWSLNKSATVRRSKLQWVHGRMAVVMLEAVGQIVGDGVLQWVHGRMAVVMEEAH